MANTVNVYVAITKLGGKDGVLGRLDYIANPDRQEHLLATGGLLDEAFWQRLAKECQTTWNGQGPERKDGEERHCVEAREIIVVLPKTCVGDINKPDTEAASKVLAGLLAEVEEFTGTKCCGAIHISKEEENNLHAHIIMAERLELAVPKTQRASRNLWLDEKGRQCKAKGDILDEEGNLREGCQIVPKGSVIAERYFTDKLNYFADKGWLYELKKDLADWINDNLDPDKKRTVFDAYSPYIAQRHIGKGDRRNAKGLKQHNKWAKEFNDFVDNGAITLDAAYRYKTLYMLAPDQTRELSRIVAEISEMRRVKLGLAVNPAMDRIILTEFPTDGRTQYDPALDRREADKQELRELYRQSSMAWALYREHYWDLENRIYYLKKARAASARIDVKRREMGDVTGEEYYKLLKKQEDDLSRLRREEYWATLKVQMAIAHNWHDQYIESLKEQRWEEWWKLFPDREKIRELDRRIEKEQEERDIELFRLCVAEREAREARKRAKREKKKIKRELRAKVKAEASPER